MNTVYSIYMYNDLFICYIVFFILVDNRREGLMSSYNYNLQATFVFILVGPLLIWSVHFDSWMTFSIHADNNWCFLALVLKRVTRHYNNQHYYIYEDYLDSTVIHRCTIKQTFRAQAIRNKMLSTTCILRQLCLMLIYC